MAGSPSRMLKLLSLLQTRRDWPGRLLAERLEISDRTLRRDIDHLRELGYRISAVKGPDGGYRLDAGSELPPLLFDGDQAVAIEVAATSGVADGEASLRALQTVRQVMPSRLRHRIDDVTFVTIPVTNAAGVAPSVLTALSRAVRTREVLRFAYVPVGHEPDAPPSPRRVELHHVVCSDGRWYLVAWDIGVGDWRVYRLDRMSPRTPTGPRFTRAACRAGCP